MEIWVLGAGGFIGKSLIAVESKTLNFMPLSKTNTVFEKIKSPDFIINLAASALDASKEQSFEANIGYPSRILNVALEKMERPFKWIQIGSYFEMQVQMGRKDFYSIDKLKFREQITSRSKTEGFELTSLILPHIFGPGAKAERLIPSAIRSFKSGETFYASSGSQFLPILHVQDAANSILAAVKSIQNLCSATPIWYGSVSELLEIIMKQLNQGKYVIDAMIQSTDSAYPRVIFPETVLNWKPEHDLSSLCD